jgi:hypothetical protein
VKSCSGAQFRDCRIEGCGSLLWTYWVLLLLYGWWGKDCTGLQIFESIDNGNLEKEREEGKKEGLAAVDTLMTEDGKG